MKREKVKVLIIDDDKTLGKSLFEGFRRAGFATTWCDSSDKALTQAQKEEFHCLLIDCMLPKMNGIDLAIKINDLSLKKPKIFMISGIYRDKAFIKETLEKTSAQAFFCKPLKLEELLTEVEVALAENETAESQIISLYGFQKLNDQDLVNLVEQENSISTFHLPALYRQLAKSSLSGQLNLKLAQGHEFQVLLREGKIFNVVAQSGDSFFGQLAVYFGFVSPEAVVEALKNDEGKLIGRRLIESFSLSPHAIQVIMEEQLAMRLSQTLQRGLVALEWRHENFPVPDFAMAPMRLEDLIHDWSTSKLDFDWFTGQLLAWNNYRLAGDYHPEIHQSISIQELLAHPQFKGNEDISYLYDQLSQGFAFLDGKSATNHEFEFLEHRASQLIHAHKTQNHFEILGISENAHLGEISRAFKEQADFFDPSRLPENCPPSAIIKCTQVFQKLEEAFMVLRDEALKLKYLAHLRRQRSQKILENEPIFHSAIGLLQEGKAELAAKRFQLLIDQRLEFSDLRSYRIWAGLKVNRSYSSLTLDMVPPEERHTAPYMMAVGISYKNRGRYRKALDAFKQAQILDPRLTIARKELEQLRDELEKKGSHKDLLKEISTLIETLFSKRIQRGA